VQTPLWAVFLIAGMGLAGTLAAGLGGQFIAQRSATNREDRARQLERERERERWEREDQARTFEHRRVVYEAYYEAVKAMALRVMQQASGPSAEPELEPDWWEPSFALLNRLIIYGTPAVAEAAGAAYACARALGDRTRIGVVGGGYQQMWDTYGQLENDLLHRIREDLQIPGGRLTVVS
jgi:hypothetical protein